MWRSWLRKLARPAPLPAAAPCYRFWDGRWWRRADPLIVLERLAEFGGADWPDRLAGYVRLVRQPPGPDASPGARREHGAALDRAVADLARLSSAVFGVRPLSDRGGLTRAGRVDVLTGFLQWAADLAEERRRAAESGVTDGQ